jgi:hypothetical protein
MTLSSEVLLMAALVGLYLFDSAQLLYTNEGLFSPSGKSGWTLVLGSDNLRVSGKDIVLPNPLLMHRPLYKYSWSFESAVPDSDEIPPRMDFLPMLPMLWSMALALFVCMPLGFFTALGDRVLLLGVILFYGNALLAMFWLTTNRKRFALSGKKLAALAFESLICPPFALNLVRHVSLSIPLKGDLVEIGHRLLGSDQWNSVRRSLLERLNDDIDGEVHEPERLARLQARREHLLTQGTSCQD